MFVLRSAVSQPHIAFRCSCPGLLYRVLLPVACTPFDLSLGHVPAHAFFTSRPRHDDLPPPSSMPPQISSILLSSHPSLLNPLLETPRQMSSNVFVTYSCTNPANRRFALCWATICQDLIPSRPSCKLVRNAHRRTSIIYFAVCGCNKGNIC